jgi:hypothetical protein
VYRGTAQPALQGVYLFADYCSGRLFGLAPNESGWQQAELLDTELLITTFGEDEAGEVYLVALNDQALYRVALQ